jgi:hypothetical protein
MVAGPAWVRNGRSDFLAGNPLGYALYAPLTRPGRRGCTVPPWVELDLTYEAMELRADPGLTLLVYTAERGSKTWEALTLLATWPATLDQLNESEADRASDAAREAEARAT